VGSSALRATSPQSEAECLVQTETPTLRSTLNPMLVPLAVGGTSVIAVVVGGAGLLMWLLFRAESRDEAEEEEQRKAAAEAAEQPPQ
jgi:hypothetical protein